MTIECSQSVHSIVDLISLRLCHISSKSSTRSFSKNEQRIKIRLSCQSFFITFLKKAKIERIVYLHTLYLTFHIIFFFHYIQIKRMPDYDLPYLQFNNIRFTSEVSSLTYAFEAIVLVLTASDAISSNKSSGTPDSERVAGISSD